MWERWKTIGYSSFPMSIIVIREEQKSLKISKPTLNTESILFYYECTVYDDFGLS